MSGASDREPFSLNPPPPAINVPQFDQQMNLYNPNGAAGFRSPPYQSMPTGTTSMTIPMNSNSNSNSNSTDQKRKRGRPRKYGPDGNMTIPMASQQQPINVVMPQQQTQIFSPPAAAPPTSAVQTETNPPIDGSVSPTFKKRGRPRGSKNKKQHSEAVAGSNGTGFVPHVLNVNAGEDVSSKIMAICQNGPRAICVLSASGTIKTVTLRQTATSGGTATYEGQFDILSLSGSFMLTEFEGQKTRTGGLSVSLAGRDGSVLGGSVAGLLIAASPAQIIVGSFMPDGQREVSVSTNYVEPSSGQLKVNAGGASSSPSRGTLSESSGGPASPLNLSSGAFNHIPQGGMSGLPWK